MPPLSRRLAISILLVSAPATPAAPEPPPLVPSVPLVPAVPSVPALPAAHAHNDYEHPRPLADALDRGFMGVEADIHLVDGRLLVAHDRQDVKPERTLQSLYLKPLAERAAGNGGRIHPQTPAPVTLLIDIKGRASETWPVLKPVLEEFRGILTEWDGAKLQERAVTVILSGSRPVTELAAEPRRLAFIDGRPEDLEKNPPASLTPWISSSWTALFSWRGQGEFPEDQKTRLREFTAKAHAQGRKVRFWGVHDGPSSWDLLRAGGVDILGSDDLPKLRDYLLKTEPAPAAPRESAK